MLLVPLVLTAAAPVTVGTEIVPEFLTVPLSKRSPSRVPSNVAPETIS